MLNIDQIQALFYLRVSTFEDDIHAYEDFSKLVGKSFQQVVVDDDSVTFVYAAFTGDIYTICHFDECCEDVYLEDVCGDIEDLIEEEILISELVTKEGDPLDPDHESNTWSFLKIGTRRGVVTFRWYGSSNGCYGESVGIYKLHLEILPRDGDRNSVKDLRKKGN